MDVCRTIAGVERTKDDRRIYYFVEGNIPEFPGVIFDLEHIGPHDASLRVDCDPNFEPDPQSVIKPPQRRDSQSVGSQPRMDMAKGWLIRRLLNGRSEPPWPRIAVEVIRQAHHAMEVESFCWRTVERKVNELRVEKHGEPRVRTWKLPDTYVPAGEATQ